MAHAVPSKATRDTIRQYLGSQRVVFIVLNISLDMTIKRTLARHGDAEGVADFVANVYKVYEPAGEDEDNAFNVDIEEDMSKEDVLAKVLKVIRMIKC